MVKNMKLGTKLMLGFAVVALITLLLGIVGYYGAVRGAAAIEEIGGVKLPIIDRLFVIKTEAEKIRGTMRTLAINGLSREMRERQYQNLNLSRQIYEKAWKAYEALPQTEDGQEEWKQFVQAWDAWRGENNKFMEVSRQLDKLGMLNPLALGREIESFTKDHYQLVQKVLTLMNMGEMFDGGEDHTACNLGKWVARFKTDSPTLIAEIQAMQEPHKRFHDAVRKIKAANAQEMQNIYTQEMVPAMEQVFGHFDAIIRIVGQGILLAGKAEEQLLGPVTTTMRTALEFLDKLVKINQVLAADEVKAGKTQAGFLRVFTLTSVLTGVVMAVLLGFLIARGVTKTLTRISQGMSEGADQVASASGQVSASSQSMAEGASQQAASIEETSSSMEEMSSMTRKNSENASQADTLMEETNRVVARANDSMEQLIQSMKGISTASEETSKIIKIIDEIAFQTNLLALNAAVEAARAGEAGAGFAVVAEEVRNLAIRSADAAKNTAELIDGTVKRVNDGSELVATTSHALTQVAEHSAKVGDIVSEIAEASKEQSSGIEQVNIAISEMDKVVQQNAANAEESASAAEEMSAQAGQLKGYVDDLVALVTGKKNQGNSINPSPVIKKVSFLSHPKKVGKNKIPAPGTKVVQPDQVIAFEDDSDNF